MEHVQRAMTTGGRRMLPSAFLSQDRVLVCDGAMGTMLHWAGAPLDRTLSELNVSKPHLVRDLHAAYVTAGARMIQTNTFDANRLRLARAGMADRVVEVNIAGARLAREATQTSEAPVLVAGSVGPALSPEPSSGRGRGGRASALAEQIAALADWVDVILLETFGDVGSLAEAVGVALAECDLPVIGQLTFGEDGRTLRGEGPAEVAAVLDRLDVAALGANCTVGPAMLRDVVAELVRSSTVSVSVQPNAGIPRRLGRRLRYAHNTRYFADAARHFVSSGATIVGGCCGTTPAHTRAIADAVRGLVPAARPAGSQAGSDSLRLMAPAPEEPTEESAPWPDDRKLLVIAGFRAPRGNDVPAWVEHAQEVAAAGPDLLAVTIAEPPVERVNPVAAAVLLQERVGVEVLMQVEAADRSLAALQADLLGAHALGIRLVACRTGSPRVVGDYPDPGSLWDVDSVRLIGALSGLNTGEDWRGVSTPERTRFAIGGFVHVAARDRAGELDRVEEKAEAGAGFLLTDPIIDVADAQAMLESLRTRGVGLPVIAVIAPFEQADAVARLAFERPEVATAASGWASGAAVGEDPVASTVAAVEKLRDAAAGVLVQAPVRPDLRMRDLVGALSALREAP